MLISSKSGRVFELPSEEEDAQIRAGIAGDPDTFEVIGDEVWSRMRPMGRPKTAAPKISVTIRYNAEVVEWFKSTGDGWQTRMDAVLQDYVSKHKTA